MPVVVVDQEEGDECVIDSDDDRSEYIGAKTSIDAPAFCPNCKSVAFVNIDDKIVCQTGECNYKGEPGYLPTAERKEKTPKPFKRKDIGNDPNEYRNHL